MHAPRPTRRNVLAGALALPAARAWPAFPRAAPLHRTLVVVQLRGGNDGLNTVVPREDDRYRDLRPDLALPARRLLPLDERFGFHPALERTARRYAEGEVCVVQGVGYPGPNLSHFRSQDVWDAADPVEPLPPTGWMGRDCDAALGGDPSPLAMLALGRDVLPHAMRAERALACAVPSLGRYRIRSMPRGAGRDVAAARRRAIDALNPPSDDPGRERLAEAAVAARASIEELNRVAGAEARADYPNGKLGSELALAARVITSGLPTRYVMVTQDGYDTHATQASTHRRLLAELDAALDAFLTDLAAHGAQHRALVMTVSEFGRRPAQSGIGRTAGTDHGSASMQLLLGPGARGGRAGAPVDLERLDEDGNPLHAIDFRQVFATVIEDWLGGDAGRALAGRFEKLEVLA